MMQKIYSKGDPSGNIRNIFNKISPKTVFLVCGKRSYSRSGVKKAIESAIGNTGTRIVRFSDFKNNPRLEDITKAVKVYNREKCGLVIGAGGGSALDIAKAVSILAGNSGTIKEFVKGNTRLEKRVTPSLMIPTTAGTGSESTRFAVIYIDRVKHALSHPSMVPDHVVLDPSFTESMPPYVAACTGMDALCQAIESFWSINSTERSRSYAKKAIRLAVSNIYSAVNTADVRSRINMLMAGNLSGKAINITQTTAAHAVSYPLTTRIGIPHGHGVALSIAQFIRFNDGVTTVTVRDPRGCRFVKKIMKELLGLLKVKTSQGAEEKIKDIMTAIGLERHLSALGMDNKNLETVINDAMAAPVIKNNPRTVLRKDLRGIMGRII
ncbi:phosphonoacetaldehyde reductase [Candidatus Auribacterota bacterium]